MVIGSYADITLSKAREAAKKLPARVTLGYDVAGEEQERKAEAVAKIEAEKNAINVSQLAAEYYTPAMTGLLPPIPREASQKTPYFHQKCQPVMLRNARGIWKTAKSVNLTRKTKPIALHFGRPL